MDKRLLLLLGVAVLASGCTGMGVSVSHADMVVLEEGAGLKFNYSVGDYSTAKLQSPSGQVVAETELEPENNVAGFFLSDPRPGEYKIIVQHGGETVEEKVLSYDGASPSLQDVEVEWSGNSIQRVRLEVRNSGDLPLRLDEGVVAAREQIVETGQLYKWVPPKTTEEIAVTPSFGSTISVNRAGEVRGTIQVQTSNGTIDGDFHKTFQGPELEIVEKTPHWEGNTLETVDLTVRNTGDLPTHVNATITRAGKVQGTSWGKDLPPGSSVDLEVTGPGYIYKTESGGDIELGLLVDSPSGYLKSNVSHNIKPADVSLESFTPVWEGSRLSTVKYEVYNRGDVSGEFKSEVSVNGEVVADQQNYIGPGETKSFEIEGSSVFSDTIYAATEGGTYNVSLTLTAGKQEVSDSSEEEFGSLDASLSQVSPTFFDNYDSDTSELHSVDLTVRNEGDVMLIYDSVELSIGGATRTVSLYSETELERGESRTEYLSLDGAITVSNGDHDLTITLKRAGQSLVSETVTVSTQ